MQQTATNERLTLTQCKAIAALVSGQNVTDAAKQAGVDRSTLHRWLKSDPRFVAAYNQERADQQSALREQLHSLASDAVDTVRELLSGEETPPAVRLRAALAVIGTARSRPDSIGPTEPEDVQRQWEQAAVLRRAGVF